MPSNRPLLLQGPRLTTALLPLPLLLPRMALASSSLEGLTRDLEDLLASNPLVRVIPPGGEMGDPSESEENDEERIPEDLLSLDDHLRRQLAEAPLEGFDFDSSRLGETLDPRGYLNVPLGPWGVHLGLSPEEAPRALAALQEWADPPGLFARDLTECLLIQLRRKLGEEGDGGRILREGREDLVRGDRHALARRLEWPSERLQRALKELQSLDPHPGYAFRKTMMVRPELFFRPLGPGKELSVHLAEENLPRLALEAKGRSPGESGYDHAAWREARAVLGALAQRYRGRVKVGRFLAKRQRAYLMGDLPAPEPLVLADLHRETGYHPSTLSRVLRSTWAVTPRGTVLLGHLLSRPLQGRPDLSVAALRHLLRQARHEGRSWAEVARELALSPRTVAWHGLRCGG